jgi:transcriptional antiterminator NusG
MNWYVIRVVTGKEKKTKDLISHELEIGNFMNNVSQILIPCRKTMQMRNGKKYSVEKNDFPGYILIESDLTPEMISTVKNINGVIDFLGSKNKPEPMKEKEVERILGRQALEAEDKFFVGEIIKILDGPFISFIGEISHVDEKKRTVKANVKIFGREVPVDLTYLQIQRTQ